MNSQGTMFVGVCAAALSLVATGRDLTWTGTAGTAWNLTALNWVDAATSEACAFANGDDVTIGAGATSVSLGATVKPGSVTFACASALDFGFSGNFTFQVGSGPIVKNGAGTLTVTAWNGFQAFRGYDGLVRVNAGTLAVSGANDYMSFGGGTTATFDVQDGATLQVIHRNCLGKVDDVKGCTANVVVRKGGAFQIGPDGGNHTGNSVKNLTLDGGSLVFAGKGLGAKQGTLNVLGTLAVTGDVAQVISDASSYGNCRVGMAWQKNENGEATGVARTVFDVADVTGDDQPDLTFATPLTRGFNVNYIAGLVKTGAGKMRLAYEGTSDGSSDNYGRQLGPNGDIDILEGTLDFGGKWTVPVPNDVAQNIYVGTNATLLVSHPEAICNDCLTTVTRRPLTRITLDHGTFRIDCPDFTSGHCFLGDKLIVDDGAFETTLNGNDDNNYKLGALSFGSLLHVKGTKPFTLSPFDGMKNARLALLNDGSGKSVATEIRVEDVTGDDAADVTIGFKLCDYRFQASGATSTLASGLVKTGTGTLLLAPVTNTLNIFSGNVEVREGTLRLDAHNPATYGGPWFGTNAKTYLGDMKNTGLNANRTVTVYTNATLALGQRNMFSGYGYGETGGNEITTKFILRGGTLRFDGDNTANSFGDITVDGGEFSYGAMPIGVWGAFNFRGTFKLTGGKPLTLPACTTPRLALYPSYASVFDIDDVTGDSAPDLISNLAPCKPADKTYYNGTKTDGSGNPYVFTYGFTKRGAGTMALERAMRDNTDFDAEARIEAGTLLFNDDFSKAGGTVVVGEGAAVGGTGKIAGVKAFASGAGFVATAGQKTPLEIGGDLALPETGFIDLVVPDGVDRQKAYARVARVAGSLAGAENLKNWQVRFNGVVEPGAEVLRSGNLIRAGHLPGLAVVLR